MFDFIKKIFSSKEPEQVEVALEELESWFNKKVSKLSYNIFLKNYFQEIKKLKKELKEKTEKLSIAEINEKEHKGVDDRVRNVVKGHRDNYVREAERFGENINVIEKENFSTIEDYKQALEFNKRIDKKIEELAKRTAKSYQASQHLFFEPVEAVFKIIGQTNLLVKKFTRKISEKELTELEEIKQKIKSIFSEKEKGKDFEKKSKEKAEFLEGKRKELEEKEKELNALKESPEHEQLLKQKQEIEKLETEIKKNENEIFTFLSKLNKPLRKYERVALDSKLIALYLENATKSFFNDEELKIKEVLQGLKRSIDSLNFEEKQKNNFIELIDKSETSFLNELLSSGKKLKEDKEIVVKEINQSEVSKKIEEKEKEIDNSKERIERIEKELEELKSKLEKIDLEKVKQEVKEKLQNLFFVEITFSSS